MSGGLVDPGESSRHAAYRETREETVIVVKITHRLFTGNINLVKVFVGRPVAAGCATNAGNSWTSAGGIRGGSSRKN